MPLIPNFVERLLLQTDQLPGPLVDLFAAVGFQAVWAALNPGGQLILLEQFAGRAPTPLAEAVAQILGLSFYHLLGGQIYPYAEVAGWLAEAGFPTPRPVALRQAPGSSLVVATRAG